MARNKKKSKQRPRWYAGAAAILLAALLLTALGWRLRELRGQVELARQERDQYKEKVETMRRENAILAANLEEGVTQEKMEEIARGELGMVLPGEYVFYTTGR